MSTPWLAIGITTIALVLGHLLSGLRPKNVDLAELRKSLKPATAWRPLWRSRRRDDDHPDHS